MHGLVVAWGWENDRTFGGQVAGPTRETSVIRFSFDDTRLRQKGIVMWFDEEWILDHWSTGNLRELVRPARPATVEDIYE